MPAPQEQITKALLYYSLKTPAHRGKWRIIEKLRNGLGLQVSGETTVGAAGLAVAIDPSDHTQKKLFWFGEKDRWEMLHALRLCGPESVIFDVGANFGYYAVRLASELGERCRIHAFEPHPETRQRLLRNISLNHLSQITVHSEGLSDQVGSAGMESEEGHSGGAHVVSGGSGIALTTMDEFCREQAINKLDFVKVDVEGFEERLIMGAVETLQRLRPALLMEFNPIPLQRTSSSVEALVRHLEAHGYRLFEPQRDRLEPIKNLPQGEEYINVFCLPQSVLKHAYNHEGKQNHQQPD